MALAKEQVKDNTDAHGGLLVKNKVRSPLVWVGGKTRLLDWLLPQLNIPCRVYVEPFGGSAAVLLNRERVPVEIYNDADGEVVNLLRCVAAHPEELQRQLAVVPYAREIYTKENAWLRAGQPGSMTDLQRAARWWWLNMASFGGQMGAGFGCTAKESMQKKTRSRIQCIDQASERLRDVLIEHEDFRVVIDRYDRPGALLYCDPPYVDHEDPYKGEGAGFTEADHRDLAELLNKAQGKVALSYYPCRLVDELYPAPAWRRSEKRHLCVLTNFREVPDADQERTELLLMNYDPPAQQQLF